MRCLGSRKYNNGKHLAVLVHDNQFSCQFVFCNVTIWCSILENLKTSLYFLTPLHSKIENFTFVYLKIYFSRKALQY